ncbi:hypothetical protein HDU93_001904, partial [Gonapodya sp. JEL0774]
SADDDESKDGSDKERKTGSGGGSDDGFAKKSGAGGSVKGKKDPKQKKAVLSFGDEENADTEPEFKIKKSSASRRFGQSADVFKSAFPTDDGAAESRRYDAQSLLALKKESTAARPTGLLTSSQSPIPGLPFQPPSTDAIDVDLIPDAAKIYAARKLREQRRLNPEQASSRGSASDDFVPLDGRSGAVSTHLRESRLVTEDQEDEGEEAFEDHAGDTIAFGTKDKKRLRQERRAGIVSHLTEAQQDEDEEDEDLDEWKREHIRKGGARAALEAQQKEDEVSRRAAAKIFTSEYRANSYFDVAVLMVPCSGSP